MSWFTAMLIIFIKIIFPFYIGPEFQNAIFIIPATIIGVSANAVAAFISTLFMTEKETTSIMTSTVVASIINVVLSIFSAKIFGLQGVVVTLMISFVILLILRLYSMVKQQNIYLGKGFLFSLAALVVSIVIFYMIASPILLGLYLVLLAAGTLFDMWPIINNVLKKWQKEK